MVLQWSHVVDVVAAVCKMGLGVQYILAMDIIGWDGLGSFYLQGPEAPSCQCDCHGHFQLALLDILCRG